jgi:hypothetical protein
MLFFLVLSRGLQELTQNGISLRFDSEKLLIRNVVHSSDARKWYTIIW